MKICFPDSLHQDRYIYFEIKIISFETTSSFGPKSEHINTFEVHNQINILFAIYSILINFSTPEILIKPFFNNVRKRALKYIFINH